MSDEERNEMTSNTDIDLDSIPHPKDCYPVPDGAVLPAGTPCWVVHKSGAASWLPSGYQNTSAICDRGAVHLTPHPIISCPTPDDSPIIITGTSRAGVDLGATAFAVWAHGTQDWRVTTDYGGFLRLNNEQVTNWLPVVVTATELGIWDERDKRGRIDVGGYTWRWSDFKAIWICYGPECVTFGSLNALREYLGDEYLVGFADDQGGEKMTNSRQPARTPSKFGGAA